MASAVPPSGGRPHRPNYRARMIDAHHAPGTGDYSSIPPDQIRVAAVAMSIPITHHKDAHGNDALATASSARARIDKKYFVTVDIPDPDNPHSNRATVAANNLAKQQRQLFVGPAGPQNEFTQNVSGVSYSIDTDPATGKPKLDSAGHPMGTVTHVFADNDGAAARALHAAELMGLDTSNFNLQDKHNNNITPVTAEQKTFFASHPVQQALHTFRNSMNSNPVISASTQGAKPAGTQTRAPPQHHGPS